MLSASKGSYFAGPGGFWPQAIPAAAMQLAVFVGVLVLVVLVVAFVAWRAVERIGPAPDCGGLPSGPLQEMCALGLAGCGKLAGRDGAACRAAVGACLPAMEAVRGAAEAKDRPSAAALFNQVAPHVPACAAAAYKISPAAAAAAYGSGSLPPGAAPFFTDPETRRNVRALAGLAPAAVSWGLDYGAALPPASS